MGSVIIHTMTPGPTITEALRQSILDSGMPLSQIATDTGVERASISRFVRGKNSLRLDLADKLAAYFGLGLSPVKKRKG